jgi:16S rRNA processing protein RimM
MAEPTADAEFVTIARVCKVQGRFGEVLTELHTDFPERFAERRRLYAWQAAAGKRRLLQLEEYWPHKGGMVLKFEDIGSIEQAEELVGAEIQIPASERAELDEGSFYVSDLMGCLVVESGDQSGAGQAVEATEIGRVVDVNFGAGSAPLLIVNNEAGREFMIPFVERFTRKLDVKAKRIEMQLPEGMLELDAPLASPSKPCKKTGKRERTAAKRHR